MKPLSEVLAVKEKVEAELLARPGVTGVDVGYKYVDGKRTDEIAIRVMVAKKKKTVPTDEKVATTIDGVMTDVIERTFVLHQFSNRKKVDDIVLMADTTTYDPVRGGISIGPCRAIGGYVYTGTLGAVVRDNVTNDPLLLSNFHVMCVDDGWHVGDDMAQPSRVDTGSCPGNRIGALVRAALTGSVDAAVCSLVGRGWNCDIVDIGNIAGTAAAVLNAPARKRGRTTGLTHGFVDSISLSVNIDYGDGLGAKTLTNQIGFRPDTAQNPSFGQKGDSGSVVVDSGNNVIGLYFAGSSDGYGVANPIAEVLSALNISMCSPIVKVKEIKEFKELKEPIKEFKEPIKERKELIKERKEFFKERIKERKLEKLEKIEYETVKPISDNIPKLQDIPKINEGPVIPTIPTFPEMPGVTAPRAEGAVEDRLAQVEAAVEELVMFITAEMRPDLSAAALTFEPGAGKTPAEAIKKDWKELKEPKDLKEPTKELKEPKEFKEPFKEFKEPLKDRKEFKEPKETKELVKDRKDLKDRKETIKEIKEPIKEFKEHKPEKLEVEVVKPEPEFPGKLTDGPKFMEGPVTPTPVTTPQAAAGGSLEQRVAQLEAIITQLVQLLSGGAGAGW